MPALDGGSTNLAGYETRMLVFVPEKLENVAEFARQVDTQAIAQQRSVLFLTLDRNKTDQYAAARQLAIITALIQVNSVQASGVHIKAEDRIEALRRLTQPGDLVLWPDPGLLLPVNMENELSITQQALSGIQTSPASPAFPWLKPLFFWLLGLLILASFTYLEISLAGIWDGLQMKVALIFLFTLEIGAFYQLSQRLR